MYNVHNITIATSTGNRLLFFFAVFREHKKPILGQTGHVWGRNLEVVFLQWNRPVDDARKLNLSGGLYSGGVFKHFTAFLFVYLIYHLSYGVSSTLVLRSK